MPGNPWAAKAKPKAKNNPYAKRTNGKGKKAHGLAAILAAKKPKGEQEAPAREALRSPRDMQISGVLFAGVEIKGQLTAGYRDGLYRTWGTVDVINGDRFYTLHNKFGSWMCDVPGGKMIEPARVAHELGVSLNQLRMSTILTERFERELKFLKIPTIPEQKRAIEEAATAERKKAAKRAARKQAKSSSSKPNPYAKNKESA